MTWVALHIFLYLGHSHPMGYFVRASRGGSVFYKGEGHFESRKIGESARKNGDMTKFFKRSRFGSYSGRKATGLSLLRRALPLIYH